QVDAFTDRPFGGNPAAVCLMETTREDGWMLKVAQEMNLSETAFCLPLHEGYNLRWFTPATEVDLCGHATLATAHVLWETGLLETSQSARFKTRSGLLTARLDGSWILMDFPADFPQTCKAPPGMLDALGIERPVAMTRGRFDYLVEINDEQTLTTLNPDFIKLRHIDTRGVIVTARSSSRDCDFLSRFFAPAVGVNEDPVTGSAHCTLCPYWSRRLEKTDFLARQVSARGGLLRTEMKDSRVIVGGQAVTVFSGDLLA
ncbi:MAG: PhzF family phenazine biosynthesis protein, partial [Thermovirgaceae bacterium]